MDGWPESSIFEADDFQRSPIALFGVALGIEKQLWLGYLAALER